MLWSEPKTKPHLSVIARLSNHWAGNAIGSEREATTAWQRAVLQLHAEARGTLIKVVIMTRRRDVVTGAVSAPRRPADVRLIILSLAFHQPAPFIPSLCLLSILPYVVCVGRVCGRWGRGWSKGRVELVSAVILPARPTQPESSYRQFCWLMHSSNVTSVSDHISQWLQAAAAVNMTTAVLYTITDHCPYGNWESRRVIKPFSTQQSYHFRLSICAQVGVVMSVLYSSERHRIMTLLLTVMHSRWQTEIRQDDGNLGFK